MEISGAIFSIDPYLDLKEKAEQEALGAIECGTTNTIEAFQQSMDEIKISALIKVSQNRFDNKMV